MRTQHSVMSFHSSTDFDRIVIVPIGEASEANYRKEQQQELEGDTMQWTTPYQLNQHGHVDGTKTAGQPKSGDILGFYFPHRKEASGQQARDGHIIIHQIISVNEKNRRDWWIGTDDNDGSVLELSQPLTSYTLEKWRDEFKGPISRQSGKVYDLKGNLRWKTLKRSLMQDFQDDEEIVLV